MRRGGGGGGGHQKITFLKPIANVTGRAFHIVTCLKFQNTNYVRRHDSEVKKCDDFFSIRKKAIQEV